jgi:hypothetical protein
MPAVTGRIGWAAKLLGRFISRPVTFNLSA